MGKFFATLGLQLVCLVAITVQNDMCGLPSPDPLKTCVSVRLPWNPNPMFFCTDKSSFKYRKQCNNRFANHCDIKPNTLMVAAPWDCCPMVSYPDSCVNQQCPPPPFNRQCQAIEPDANQIGDCCNSYFCEENANPEICFFKRLEPSCTQPPKGKKNCIAFIDPFGCCPKFQCDDDNRKPGLCPAEREAKKYMASYNATSLNRASPFQQRQPFVQVPVYPQMPLPLTVNVNAPFAPEEQAAEEPEMEAETTTKSNLNYFNNGSTSTTTTTTTTTEVPVIEPQPLPQNDGFHPVPPAQGGAVQEKVSSPFAATPGYPNQIACIGDFNCPGKLKCCSNDMNVYVEDGQYFFKNSNPTYGYCMEPVKEKDNKDDKDDQY